MGRRFRGVTLVIAAALAVAFAACVGDDPSGVEPSDPDAGPSGADDGGSLPVESGASDGGTPVAVQVKAGSQSSCALYANGDVYCWGDNQLGELGIGTNIGADHVPPTRVAGLGAVAEISLGKSSACARTQTGEVWCWGENTYGELGTAAVPGGVMCSGTPCSPAPIRVLGIAATQIAVGDHFACAAVNGGSVFCWGHNKLGQAGQRLDAGEDQLPTKVAGIANITRINFGYDGRSACALDVAHAISCWGANDRGQLGHAPGSAGDTIISGTPANATPAVVPGLPPASDIIAASTVCAAVADGGVYCWGRNSGNELLSSAPDNAAHPTPTLIAGLQGTEAVDGSEAYCALDNAGVVRCWGPGLVATGSQGIDGGCVNTNDSPRPCQTLGVVGGPALKSIGVGAFHALGITTDDKVVGWGDDAYGRVGIGGDGGALISTMVPIVGLP